MLELRHDLPTGKPTRHLHAHAAHRLATFRPCLPQTLQTHHPALTARAPSLHPLPYPDLFLRQQPIGLALDHGLLGQLCFLEHLILRKITGVAP